MDGVHDLGGKHGFGPIDVNAPPFRHAWEARQWAISKNSAPGGGTLDWWRFMIENMEPATYLSIPYFEKWCLNHLTDLITQDVFTLDEAIEGKLKATAEPAPIRSVAQALDHVRAQLRSFELPAEQPPLYQPGATVRTKRTMPAGHTRLPGYARGATGQIIAHHGAHVFPDDSARGVERPEHLYTVEFAASTLWEGEAEAADSVCIDLWESYLVST